MSFSYTYATVFLVALLLARSLTPFVAGLAMHLGAVDLPDSRKVHRGVVPRLGGLALLAGMLAPLALLLIVDTDVAQQFRTAWGPLGGLFLGLLPIVLLGLLDDLVGATALVKFPVQILAAGIAYGCGLRIGEISNPITGGTLVLGSMALPATVLWFVIVTNAINLIDGLDGLATGITAFVTATVFTLSNANSHVAVAVVALALCGASIGFLRYNFPPASVFLGDIGSLSAGYLIAGISVLGAQKSSTAIALFVPIVALGVPLFDTFTSFWRRLIHMRHPFQADAEHIHHRLLARGASQRTATLLLYGVTGILMVLALAVAYFDSPGNMKPMGWTLFATAAFILAVGGFLGYLNIVEIRMHAASGVRRRRLRLQRARAISSAVQRLDAMLLPTGHIDRMEVGEAWGLLTDALEQLGFTAYHLNVLAGERFEKSVEGPTIESEACYHARALVLKGTLIATLVAAREGDSVSRARDSEALDELVAVILGAMEREQIARDREMNPGGTAATPHETTAP